MKRKGAIRIERVDLSRLVVTRVVSVVNVNYDTMRSNRHNNREHWALMIKNEGKTVYTVGEREYVSDPDHILLLPQGISYVWRTRELGACCIIEFDALYDGAVTVTSFPGKRRAELTALASQMEKKWTFKKPAYTFACMAGVYQMLGRLAEQEIAGYVAPGHFAQIELGVRYMEDHFSDSDLTNAALASVCGISEVYFRKLFHACYHDSPMRYLRVLRIEKAKDLLRSEFASIAGISSAVGFESVYHFSKVFKKATGFSPSEFRQLNQ